MQKISVYELRTTQRWMIYAEAKQGGNAPTAGTGTPSCSDTPTEPLTTEPSGDGIPVGDGDPGPVTRDLQERFLAIARGEAPDPYGWRQLQPSDRAARVS
jgi:branched-chain amino acid aminotransferase